MPAIAGDDAGEAREIAAGSDAALTGRAAAPEDPISGTDIALYGAGCCRAAYDRNDSMHILRDTLTAPLSPCIMIECA